jgi:multiple sugar transport system substrate-binding protein
MFNGLLWQAGARPFSQATPTSVKVNVNSPEAQKVVTFWENLIKAGDVSTDPDFNTDWDAGFNTGKYASWITAGWGLDTLRTAAPKTSGDWRAAPIPTWTAGQPTGANWGGSSDAVTKATKCPAAAAAFAMFINASPESANNLAYDKVLFPPVKSILADPKYSAQTLPFYGNTAPVKVFADASATVATDFQYSPFQDYAYAQLSTDVGAQFTKTGDPLTGLVKWQSDLETFAKKNGFTLEK